MSRLSSPPGAVSLLDSGAESLDQLREDYLRRIMRAACAAGTLGIAGALLGPQPYNAPGLVLGIVANIVVFSLTLLPQRLRVLSLVYPWSLSMVGVALTRFMGPGAVGFLLVAGGLFMGSIILRTRGLLALAVATTLGLLASALVFTPPLSPDLVVAWTDATFSMAAVIVPAALAGRLLMRIVTRSLTERERLVEDLRGERKALEEVVKTLENTRTQLTHAQKLEVIAQLSGGIAHDMNNALTTIMGEASLLGDDVAQQRERLLEASTHAAALTQQLMVFGRRETSQPRPIELAETLHHVVQSIRRMLPSDIVVHVEAPRQGLRVQADPTQLLQIMMNLSVNAKDAMPEGGKLTFRLTPLTESNEAQIEVTDTGTGIPKEEMKQIFEPFYTTKLAGKGTGLGLANVQRLVQEMGGRIEVESARGQGASFTIRLPLTDAKVLAPVPHEVELTKGTGSILVLDDDVRVRAFVFTALGKMGYHVYEASRLSAALELAKAHPAELALLLTDVVMEGGGGAAAIAAIRSEISDVPVLVMSGYTNDEALRRGISSGKFPFLPKPFTAEQLGVAVREAISKRQVREPKGAP